MSLARPRGSRGGGEEAEEERRWRRPRGATRGGARVEEGEAAGGRGVSTGFDAKLGGKKRREENSKLE